MVALYKVATRHTKQVLKDFIKFTYKVKNPKANLRLYTLAGCFFVISAAYRELKTEMIVCASLGILILLFTFFRHEIAFFRLAKSDPNYKQQSEIIFSFDMGEFAIQTDGIVSPEKLKYSQITSFYKDSRNYYIGINNEELHILPYSDFQLGNVKEFSAFIKGKVKKEVVELKVPLKEQIRHGREAMKLAEKQHDQRIAEKKKNTR